MRDIFKKVCERIKQNEALFIEQGLEPIRHFDLFKGQYLNPEQVQPYDMPALFYEFRVDWNEAGGNTQEGNCTVRIHLELENIGESYEDSPDQNTAFEVFDYCMILNVLLQGLTGNNFTGLRRVTDDPDLSPSATAVHIIQYECLYTDTSTERMKGFVFEALDDVEFTQVKEPEPIEATGKYIL